MDQSEQAYLTGRLLVAMPGIGDPRFERSVILVCAHDEDHAMGLVVNRPAGGLTLEDLFKQLDVPSEGAPRTEPVVMGGPVQKERGFVLHSDDCAAGEGVLDVPGGLRVSASREILFALADPQKAPRRALMALGYAGWGAGQLENEIRQNVWLTAEPDEEIIFGPDHVSKWSKAMAKLGIAPERLSSQGGWA
jgi:putative transcriptional regulator